MNSTQPMNSNFFIVFSFQQNKLYPNGLIIVNWMMVCLTTINLNNLLAYVQPLLTFPLDGYFCSKLKQSIFTKHSSIKKEILTTNFLNQTYANLHFVLSSLCFCLRYLLQLPGMSSCFDQTLCKKYTSQCMTSLLLVALVHVYLALFFSSSFRSTNQLFPFWRKHDVLACFRLSLR